MNTDENPNVSNTYRRGQRQIDRLVNLEIKIADILNQRPVAEQLRILSIIENAADLVDAFNDLPDPQKEKSLIVSPNAWTPCLPLPRPNRKTFE